MLGERKNERKRKRVRYRSREGGRKCRRYKRKRYSCEEVMLERREGEKEGICLKCIDRHTG
jgi:hypothetical protein